MRQRFNFHIDFSMRQHGVIDNLLLSVQATILFDKKSKNRFVLPSAAPSLDIRKIYKLMDVPLRRSVYKI